MGLYRVYRCTDGYGCVVGGRCSPGIGANNKWTRKEEEMSDNIETLVGAYVACRDSLSEKRREFKAEEVRHKKDMDIIAVHIKELADIHGVDSFKTAHGTAYRTTKDFVKVADWDTVLEFVLANDLKHLLTKSVAKAAVKEFMAENNNTLPPGLNYGAIVEIAVRRK